MSVTNDIENVLEFFKSKNLIGTGPRRFFYRDTEKHVSEVLTFQGNFSKWDSKDYTEKEFYELIGVEPNEAV